MDGQLKALKDGKQPIRGSVAEFVEFLPWWAFLALAGTWFAIWVWTTSLYEGHIAPYLVGSAQFAAGDAMLRVIASAVVVCPAVLVVVGGYALGRRCVGGTHASENSGGCSHQG